MKSFFSIILPVYNEEKAIKKTVTEIKQYLKLFRHEIIVVNDGSTDKSGRILDTIKGIHVIHQIKNKGYGNSLKTGICKAKGDWIIICDSDGTYPIENIPKLIKYTKTYDMIIGARIGKTVQIPLFRRPAKWFLTLFASYIAGRKIPDLNSGMRVFRKDIALRFWNFLPEKFSFTTTISMGSLTNGYDVKYVPINYYKRKGTSTIRPVNDFIEFNKLILKLCLFFRPLKVFIPLSFIIFLSGVSLIVLNYFISGIIQLTDSTILLIMSSFQVFILGLIAELIVRVRV